MGSALAHGQADWYHRPVETAQLPVDVAPVDMNVITGPAHFIKTADDMLRSPGGKL